jgi:hypothetical protein
VLFRKGMPYFSSSYPISCPSWGHLRIIKNGAKY